jgi:hypothetical protein
MGRFESEDESDNWQLDMGRWKHNFPLAINGKRGQRVLRDLEAALLALPERRLISGFLATPDGEVCALGALVAARKGAESGKGIREAAAELAAESGFCWGQVNNVGPGEYRWIRWDCEAEDDYERTLDAAKAIGVTQTLAWAIGDLNDESLAYTTPEQRWEEVLEWVRSRIKVDKVETS